MSDNSALEKIKTKVKSGKVIEILIVLVLAAVVFFIIFTSFGNEEKTASADSAAYAENLENKLSSILSQISGAGKVDVFITAESEGEKVIATETIVDEDGTVTTTPVFSGGDIVILEEKNPEITGVLIVADGADDLSVRFNLLEATASVLNINQSIIKVYTRNGDSK